MTTADDNEQLARRFAEEVWENENYEAMAEMVAEDYVLHDSTMPEPLRGPEELRDMLEMGTDVVDGETEIEQLIATDEYVITRWRQEGTHEGAMAGVEPTHENVTVTGMQIDRIEDGTIAETWQEVNVVTMLLDIGAIDEDRFEMEMPADD